MRIQCGFGGSGNTQLGGLAHRAPPVDLPYRVIRVNAEDEVIARGNNLLVGRAAYETAVRLYPRDTMQYRDGARIIARSDRGKPLA